MRDGEEVEALMDAISGCLRMSESAEGLNSISSHSNGQVTLAMRAQPNKAGGCRLEYLSLLIFLRMREYEGTKCFFFPLPSKYFFTTYSVSIYWLRVVC